MSLDDLRQTAEREKDVRARSSAYIQSWMLRPSSFHDYMTAFSPAVVLALLDIADWAKQEWERRRPDFDYQDETCGPDEMVFEKHVMERALLRVEGAADKETG